MLKRSVLEALAACTLAVLLWGLIGGALRLLLEPISTVGDALAAWPRSFIWIAVWSAFVGLLALPVYVLLFALWHLLARRSPRLDAPRNRVPSAVLLAIPLALLLAASFGTPRGHHFNWTGFAMLFPFTLLCSGAAVYFSRRMIASAKASHQT